MRKKGLIQIYTGDGKGKTTAAVGLAIRARSHNIKACYVYFHKNPEKYGYSEHNILKKSGVDVFGFAKAHPFCDKKVNFADIRQDCLKGLAFIKKIYARKNYGLLILDEINISLREGFLKMEEIVPILTEKPPSLELVLTGRGAPQRLIKLADLVSRIQKVKHPYDKGIKRREGIEY